MHTCWHLHVPSTSLLDTTCVECALYSVLHTLYCSPDAEFRFLVESNNPCEGGQPFVGFMTVTANSSDCERDWVETGGYDVEV